HRPPPPYSEIRDLEVAPLARGAEAGDAAIEFISGGAVRREDARPARSHHVAVHAKCETALGISASSASAREPSPRQFARDARGVNHVAGLKCYPCLRLLRSEH